MLNKLIKEEQELDKIKDDIAMRIGYKIIELRCLFQKYDEAEKRFADLVKKARQN